MTARNGLILPMDSTRITHEEAMSDLIQRLDRACGGEFPDDYSAQDYLNLCHESRDELERAKAELAELKRDDAYLALKLAADDARERAERAEAELAKCGRENCMGYKEPGYLNWVTEARLKQVKAERDTLRSIILWALGENGEFPERPEDWEQRKHKPWYWWRTEMRNKFDAAMQRGKEQSNG